MNYHLGKKKEKKIFIYADAHPILHPSKYNLHSIKRGKIILKLQNYVQLLFLMIHLITCEAMYKRCDMTRE